MIEHCRTIDPHALKIPEAEGAESSLTENATFPFQAEPEQILYNSRSAASASFAMLMSNSLNSGCWPMNSPDAIRKFAAPSASICPGEVGRITAQRGKFGLMNSQGTGKIRLV